ncbi:hypothetical protein AB205_0200010 [Aquarana catesbeiana]|uniref:Uncharacterized protein n=1 Tax=Aquarana catesbeiana TaxID=8400 RepID=A0A2G9S2M0_AQUCT|nr:hypothetical protein AB205_0200010 [Aquarana catesbeiana]
MHKTCYSKNDILKQKKKSCSLTGQERGGDKQAHPPPEQYQATYPQHGGARDGVTQLLHLVARPLLTSLFLPGLFFYYSAVSGETY